VGASVESPATIGAACADLAAACATPEGRNEALAVLFGAGEALVDLAVALAPLLAEGMRLSGGKEGEGEGAGEGEGEAGGAGEGGGGAPPSPHRVATPDAADDAEEEPVVAPPRRGAQKTPAMLRGASPDDASVGGFSLSASSFAFSLPPTAPLRCAADAAAASRRSAAPAAEKRAPPVPAAPAGAAPMDAGGRR
jgi:hypothetical protein